MLGLKLNHVSKRGHRASSCLYTWMTGSSEPSPTQAQLHPNMFLQMLHDLGMDHQLQRVRVESMSTLQHHQHAVNTCTFTVASPRKMHFKILRVLEHWTFRPNVSAKDLSHFPDMLNFMVTLVARGSLCLHPLQW